METEQVNEYVRRILVPTSNNAKADQKYSAFDAHIQATSLKNALCSSLCKRQSSVSVKIACKQPIVSWVCG